MFEYKLASLTPNNMSKPLMQRLASVCGLNIVQYKNSNMDVIKTQKAIYQFSIGSKDRAEIRQYLIDKKFDLIYVDINTFDVYIYRYDELIVSGKHQKNSTDDRIGTAKAKCLLSEKCKVENIKLIDKRVYMAALKEKYDLKLAEIHNKLYRISNESL